MTDSFYGASGTSPPVLGSRMKHDVRGTANYSQIKVALARLLTFKGNSMSARWEQDSAGNATFVVYSYSTPIAGHTPSTGETWTDDHRFSVTTSKHQGYVRGYLPGASHVPSSERPLWTSTAPKPEVCLTCGQVIEPDLNGWAGGHNPEPLNNDPVLRDRRVCGDCNGIYVIPARLGHAVEGTFYDTDGEVLGTFWTVEPEQVGGAA